VIAHSDPADSVTAAADSRRAPNYRAALTRGALKGARIGILRQAYDRPSLDAEVNRVFEQAVADLRRAGAVVIRFGARRFPRRHPTPSAGRLQSLPE
jgi:Asp-tRNA(Asn)/Glu-tRNA(Gln) amidotransferase A subunit family amidase